MTCGLALSEDMFEISILKSTLFCLSPLSLFSTPFPWTNLTAKYIYGFLLTRRRYSDHFKVDMWEFLKKFYLSYSEKCPSEHNAMCPSEHNTQKVSFRTQSSKSVLPNRILQKCPSEHNAKCPSKHEAEIKVPPLQLALKPTHTQRANIMGP